MDHRRGAFDNPISRAVDPAAVLQFGSEIASLLLLPRWRVSGRAADRERFSSRRFAPGDSQEQNTPRVDEKVDLSRTSLNLSCLSQARLQALWHKLALKLECETRCPKTYCFACSGWRKRGSAGT